MIIKPGFDDLFFREYLAALRGKWWFRAFFLALFPEFALVRVPFRKLLAAAVTRWRRGLVLAMGVSRGTFQADVKM